MIVYGKKRGEKQLCDLKPGEWEYAVPWAMDRDGRLLDDTVAHKASAGTATMKVTALEYGYEVSDDDYWAGKSRE